LQDPAAVPYRPPRLPPPRRLFLGGRQGIVVPWSPAQPAIEAAETASGPLKRKRRKRRRPSEFAGWAEGLFTGARWVFGRSLATRAEGDRARRRLAHGRAGFAAGDGFRWYVALFRRKGGP
jgi:hypothetical protein